MVVNRHETVVEMNNFIGRYKRAITPEYAITTAVGAETTTVQRPLR